MQKKCFSCGKAFECENQGAGCWCAKFPPVLPVPKDGSDCLCPDCLAKACAAPGLAPVAGQLPETTLPEKLSDHA
jgi:hypothetical protein